MKAKTQVKVKNDPAQRLPDGFPPALVPHAREVYKVLRSVAEERGARMVTPRALGRVMMAFPGRHYVSEAHSWAAWVDDRPEVPVKDVTARYRMWLSRSPVYAGVEPLGVPVPSAGNVHPIRPNRNSVPVGAFREAARRMSEQEGGA